MSNIATLDGAAYRGPDSPESQARIFLRLSEKWALGYDPLQWMVMRWRGKAKGWRPISFVASNKVVLMRVLEEDGCEITPEARTTLKRLPDTFKECLAEQNRQKVAWFKTWRKYPAGFFVKPLPGGGLRHKGPNQKWGSTLYIVRPVY